MSLPSISDFTARKLKQKLWADWFGPAQPNPFEAFNQDAPPEYSPLRRIWERRQRRAKIIVGILWPLVRALLPLISIATRHIAQYRMAAQQRAPRAPQGVAIAVGNWIIGGAGKTPVCIALVKVLQAEGFHPAVLSRGYGRRPSSPSSAKTRVIMPDDLFNISPLESGDEPWLICWRAGCPVGVGANRYETAKAVLAHAPATNIWILDDGLSQTSLRPDLRILIADARGHGNQKLLPAGPLRAPWPPKHADMPDYILNVEPSTVSPSDANQPSTVLTRTQAACFTRTLSLEGWVYFSWHDGQWTAQTLPLNPLPPALRAPESGILAIAGIAQPQLFFESLMRLGLQLTSSIALEDHEPRIAPKINAWRLSRAGLALPTLVMTEKDAVKFWWEQSVAYGVNPETRIVWWALRLRCDLPRSFTQALTLRLKEIRGTHG